MVDDLIEAIRAVEEYRRSRKEFEDKYLINGYLCVTPEQYQAIRDMCEPRALDSMGSPISPIVPAGGIQVLVINPGENRDVGNGWTAVNVDGTVYGFNRAQIEEKLKNSATPRYFRE